MQFRDDSVDAEIYAYAEVAAHKTCMSKCVCVCDFMCLSVRRAVNNIRMVMKGWEGARGRIEFTN